MLLFFPTNSDAAALINDDAIIDSNASEEIDGSLRAKKESGLLTAQQVIPSPLRRHHLKFGVLGKRHSYGYLGKRANGKNNIVFFRTHSASSPLSEAQLADDYEEWLSELRERRAGRPQYGMLG